MSHSDDSIESQQKESVEARYQAEKGRIMFTHAFDVLLRCLKLWYLNKENPKDVHATASGFRAVVDFNGQQYEVIVNPLYKFSQTAEVSK